MSILKYKYLKYKEKYENENIQLFKKLYKKTINNIYLDNFKIKELKGGSKIILNNSKKCLIEYIKYGIINLVDSTVNDITLKLETEDETEIQDRMYFYGFNTKHIINKEYK